MDQLQGFTAGDHVLVASGPYWMRAAVVEAIPDGFQHPLVILRFLGSRGQPLKKSADLVNVRRLCNFGKPATRE